MVRAPTLISRRNTTPLAPPFDAPRHQSERCEGNVTKTLGISADRIPPSPPTPSSQEAAGRRGRHRQGGRVGRGGPGRPEDIRESVDGKALAVDLSLWILQACTQPALDEVFNEDLGFDDPDASKTAKIVFDRALNYLRHGCVPVGVIDGQAPWEKLGALRARWGAQCTGGGGGAFGRCGDVALSVLRALGLPGVEAPGEAEATCAAIDSPRHRRRVRHERRGLLTLRREDRVQDAEALRGEPKGSRDGAGRRRGPRDAAHAGRQGRARGSRAHRARVVDGGRLRLAGCAERGRHQGAVSGQGAGQERGESAPTRGKGRRTQAGPDVTRAPRRLPRVSSGPEHCVPG